jgi:hypothetical protein
VQKVTRGRIAVAIIAALVMVAGFVVPSHGERAEAAVAADFDAAEIISDSVFYNASAMDEGTVQSFLRAKGPSCQMGYTCLKDYAESTSSRAADARCSGYYGQPNESAARIIVKVAQACGINPQVLIVLLQKEQGLVTSSSPSASKYRIAAGYGCPDTAACDSTYYGFFNQLYSAARQFQVYAQSSGSFRYRAGMVNYIQWHPNGGCGGSNVSIVNRATAALYNYTPYQPNSAALGNLYGTGDGCSSYGNRNFFTYFTDWFGSTKGSHLVRTAENPTVYLVTDTAKYGVPTMELVYNYSALGPVRTVSQGYLDALATGPVAGVLVRDEVNGNVFMVVNSVKYRFASCELVAAYGLSCGSVANLPAPLLAKFSDGGEVSSFSYVPGDSTIYHMVEGLKNPVYDANSLVALNGWGRQLSLTPMPWYVAHGVTTGDVILGWGALVRTESDTSVYLIDGTNRRILIRTYDLLVALGTPPVSVVSPTLLNRYVSSGALASPALSCGGTPSIAGGQIFGTTQPGYGLPVTVLDTRTCAAWPQGGAAFDEELFVRDSAGTIYAVIDGAKRPIPTMSSFQALFGPGEARYVQLSGELLATWPSGPPIAGSATMVKLASSPTVYLIDGGGKKIVSTFDSVYALGASPVIDAFSQQLLDAYPTSGTLNDSPMIRCGAEHYVGGGILWPVSKTDGYGLAINELDPATCRALPKAPGAFGDDLFVRTSDGSISLVTAGVKRPIVAWADLEALSGPAGIRYAQLADRYVGRWPAGPQALGPARLAKTSTADQVYIVDGLSNLVALPRFEVAREMGLSLDPALLPAGSAGYTVSGAIPFPVVRCGVQDYVAAGGVLIPWNSASHGLTATVLEPRTCDVLLKGQPASGRLFIGTPGQDTVYFISGAQKHLVSSWEALVQLSGTTNPRVLYWSDGNVSAIPTGSPA